MNRIIGLLLLSGFILPVTAQRTLSLDSCRALALRNNKQVSVSKMKQEIASNIRKSARTKYLPHVNVLGAYEYMSKEVSLLNNTQKDLLSNLGTRVGEQATGVLTTMMESPFMANVISQLSAAFQMSPQDMITGMAQGLNAQGQKIVDGFRTDTRHTFAGSVVVTQPVFMGGAIIAMNKMADIGERMTHNSMDEQLQHTIYTTDQAYWQVVSLKHKKRLAESYLALVKKLSDDVDKMIREGVATRSEGLSVDVKENEAEMQVTMVNDGLVLAKMYLCQLCGLPLDTDLVLEDEDADYLQVESDTPQMNMETAFSNRPELRLLQNTVDLSKQATNILRATQLPQVLLMGGYAVSNPNLFNGFEKKFAGFWNVGVLVRIPVWNWGDVAYKVRASKGATAIANLELQEAREKVELQVNQMQFKVDESSKRLLMAQANIRRAEENLRTATLGFQEGVIQSTTVMEAQTAWLQAQTQKIDAEIDVRLSQVNLRKALGTLGVN